MNASARDSHGLANGDASRAPTATAGAVRRTLTIEEACDGSCELAGPGAQNRAKIFLAMAHAATAALVAAIVRSIATRRMGLIRGFQTAGGQVASIIASAAIAGAMAKATWVSTVFAAVVADRFSQPNAFTTGVALYWRYQ